MYEQYSSLNNLQGLMYHYSTKKDFSTPFETSVVKSGRTLDYVKLLEGLFTIK